MADEIIDLCGNVKITVDIPKGTKCDQNDFYGLVQKSVKSFLTQAELQGQNTTKPGLMTVR